MACRLIDTDFGDVTRGCLDFDVVRCGDDYEMWINGRWVIGCKPKHFVDKVRGLLATVFALFGMDQFGREVLKHPPPPLQQDEFIDKASATMIKYLPTTDNYVPLDSNTSLKLLANDGMLYDRSNGCLLYTSPSPRDRQKSRMPSSA